MRAGAAADFAAAHHFPSNGSGPFDPNDSNFKPYLNWEDMGCLWVSIDHKSGLVSTAENNASATAFNNGVTASRQHAGLWLIVELIELWQLAIELALTGRLLTSIARSTTCTAASR